MRQRIAQGLAVLALLGMCVPARAAMTTEQRLEALERLIRSQQEEIRQLRNELKQQKAVGTATQQQAERAEEQAKTVEKKQTTMSKVHEQLSKFTPFGDFRLRYEGFFDQATKEGTKTTARNRVRIRYRLGFTYKYSDELSATIRLASGNPDDPISTNETLTGDFTRKHVNLDWAYITVTPGQTFGWRPGIFSMTGGKFPNPIFRVGQMVFDDDLSPEGFSETLTLLDHPYGGLDQVRIYGEQWTFNEVSNGSDGWMFGGQINPVGHVGDVVLEGGIGQYWWNNANLIAQALNTNSSLVNTNLVYKMADGDVVAYQSGYYETNVTAAATIPEVAGKPLKLYVDYVHNWQAVNHDSNGIMGGLRFGQTKQAGDWDLWLYYEYLQQEAAISAFTFSDFGNGGTNVQGPVIALDYQLFDPLTLTATSYFTSLIDPPPDLDNRMQVRVQLDAQIKF